MHRETRDSLEHRDRKLLQQVHRVLHPGLHAGVDVRVAVLLLLGWTRVVSVVRPSFSVNIRVVTAAASGIPP
jgi:hypothetical protein